MVVVTALAIGWGGLVAALTLNRASGIRARTRVRDLAPVRGRRRPQGIARLHGSMVGRIVRDVANRSQQRRASRVLAAQVPVTIDLLTVAASAGCSPIAATEIAATWSPPVVSAPLAGMLRSTSLGMSFADAVDSVGRVHVGLRPLTDALATAARLGTPLRPTLERLSIDSRAGLRRVAETRARTVPVRLLFPLVFLVLPAFCLLTVVPAVYAGLRGG